MAAHMNLTVCSVRVIHSELLEREAEGFQGLRPQPSARHLRTSVVYPRSCPCLQIHAVLYGPLGAVCYEQLQHRLLEATADFDGSDGAGTVPEEIQKFCSLLPT